MQNRVVRRSRWISLARDSRPAAGFASFCVSNLQREVGFLQQIGENLLVFSRKIGENLLVFWWKIERVQVEGREARGQLEWLGSGRRGRRRVGGGEVGEGSGGVSAVSLFAHL